VVAWPGPAGFRLTASCLHVPDGSHDRQPLADPPPAQRALPGVRWRHKPC